MLERSEASCNGCKIKFCRYFRLVFHLGTNGRFVRDSLKMDKEKLEAERNERFLLVLGGRRIQGANSKSLIARLPAREWEGISGKNRAELHSARRGRRRGMGCRLYARGGERGREREALITESTGRRLRLKSGVVREQNNVSVIENA